MVVSGISYPNAWTAQTTANQNWRSITYGNGLFVAVSSTGTTQHVMTSPDGATWTLRTSAENNPWIGITYGNGLFVAVATTGTNQVMTSPDGITWTTQTASSSRTWQSIAYGNGLFFATSTDSRGMSSPDGITWTDRPMSGTGGFTYVSFANGLFIASGGIGSVRLATSPDGITWTARTQPEANNLGNVVYGNGLYVVTATSGTQRAATSPDGITWTGRTTPTPAQAWGALAYGNHLFVAVDAGGTSSITSPDGITWTLVPENTPSSSWNSISFHDGTFVAVGNAATSGAMTSTQGNGYAYGVAADTLISPTFTFTQPNGETTSNAFLTIVDSATLTTGKTGTSTSITGATTLTQNFVVDTGFAQGTYLPTFVIAGNSALTSLPWTILQTTGHGAGLTRDSNTQIHSTTTFNIDPRIIPDSTGTNLFTTADDKGLTKIGSSTGAVATLFNRQETVYIETYVINSQDNLLSRSMTFSAQDSAATACGTIGTLTPTSNKYSTTFTTGTLCLAAADFTGSLRYLVVTNTGETHTSTTASYYISSLYATDVHTQKSAVLSTDEFPTQNSNEDQTFIISSDTTNVWCHVESVRKDGTQIHTSTNAFTIKVTEVDDTTVLGTLTTQTDTTGWSAKLTVNPNAPSRTVNAHCDGTYLGNTIQDIQSIGWISAFTADKICRVSLPADAVNNTAIRLYVHTEKNGASLPPDLPPTLQVDSGQTGAPDTWQSRLPATTMLNVVDNTATVNGALYYYDWTPNRASTPSLLVTCRMEGAPLQFENPIQVHSDSMNIDLLHPMGTISDPGLGWFAHLALWTLIFYGILRTRNLFSLPFALGGVLELVNPSWFFGLSSSLPWIGLGFLIHILLQNLNKKKNPKGT